MPINYISKSKNQNNEININIIHDKKCISNSPNYYFPKSVLNENNKNKMYINTYEPKSDISILINKNINRFNFNKNMNRKNIITQNYSSNNYNNYNIPKGFFDDYLINNNNSTLKKNNGKQIVNRNNRNNNIFCNNFIYKTKEINDKKELKIEKYDNFFINNSKIKKDSNLQTENKIINFSYIGVSKTALKNFINNNKITNAINFSLNPLKLIFPNKKEDNKDKKENIENNNNKILTALVDDKCDLEEEKSIVLEDESVEENNKKKKINFDDIKIVIKYDQNDYIRNYFSLYKTKNKSSNNEKNVKNNEENKCVKIPHKFISTTELRNILKKKKKNLKSNLNKNNKSYNPDLALMKLNELISDEPRIINAKNKNEKNISPFIKKNINFIKKVEEYNKKGMNYRTISLSKKEIKLLKKKKKKKSDYKIRENSPNIIKSFQINDLENANDQDKNNDKLNNSFS
jgi:hypothetical protein